MSLIVAKYIARGDSETAHRMTELVTRTLGEINDSLSAKRRGLSADASPEPGIPLTSASNQFAVLDRLVKASHRMEKSIEAAGGSIPLDGIQQIQRFFELTKQMAAQNWNVAMQPNLLSRQSWGVTAANLPSSQLTASRPHD
jgi:hypothetical protein